MSALCTARRLTTKSRCIRISCPKHPLRQHLRLHRQPVQLNAASNSWTVPQDVISVEDSEVVNDLLHRFKKADIDGSGAIDKEELRLLLQSAGDGSPILTSHWLPQEDLDRVMEKYDKDGNGTICFAEFKQLVFDGLLLEGAIADYRAAFRAIDRSNNGTVSATELAQMLHELGQPVSYDKLVTIMQKYDVDSSGQIEFGEFMMMFRDQLLDLQAVMAFITSRPDHTSLDEGLSASASSVIAPLSGDVTVIFSEAELDEILQKNAEQLVVLFCGLTWCRPCKGMQRTYQRLADAYPNVVFLKLFGNANDQTKRIFKERLKIRSSPSFIMFRGGSVAATASGANKERLETALRAQLTGDELAPKPLYITAAA